jgi:hypothetical protein
VSPEKRDHVRSRQRGEQERAWIGAPLARIAFVAVAVSLIATWTTLAHQAGASGRHAATQPSAKTSAATGKCVNSFDPSCGAFHWDPKPDANQAMTISVTPASLSGVAGRDVSFDATAVDPDAVIACHWVLFGDEQVALIPPVMRRHQYGRWTPPAKQRGEFHLTYMHAYSKPGTYHVQFGARSGNGCESNYNPYGEESIATATVTIAAS